MPTTPRKTLPSVTKRGQSFDVNRCAVYHSHETGGGYEGLVTFCSIMNTPCLSKPAYYKQVNTIMEALEAEAEDDMRAAGQKVHVHILKENAQLTSDAILDAAVSFDGT